MKRKIVIIGSEGTARNIIEQIKNAIINYNYPADIAGVIIDIYPKDSMVAGSPVLGGTNDLNYLIKNEEYKFIFALFKPQKMKERYNFLQSLNIPVDRFTNFIHPLSYIAESVKIGNGNVILSNSSIQSNVELGNFNIINSGVTIEHDTFIGNGNFIAANACIGSKVKIGNHCFIGLNSSLRENTIIDEVYVGMHSIVLKDFSGSVIAGIPARKLDRTDDTF